MANNTVSISDVASVEAEVKRVFALQQANRQKLKNTTAQERIQKLKQLKGFILGRREGLQEALHRDFRKPAADADLTEIFPVLSAISHITRSLKKWMKPHRVSTPLNMAFTSGKTIYEPKGCALIIAPWNYPFQLTFDPLVYAIAAGCPVILKPSEMTPHTSTFMKQMISDFFDESEVALFEGDAQVAQALLKQPFDHIFFTGSPMLGKIIMKAASEHLTSVTLELGGKSPAIVDENVNLQDAAEKIIWGKFINCGQTCIAPDYVLAHKKVKKELIVEMKKALQKLYAGENQDLSFDKSPDYARIVNQRHFTRVKNLLDDALEKGAKIEEGGKSIAEENYLAPTLLSNISEEMLVSEEEIFGPILPVIAVKDLQEAVDYVAQKPKPLALYVFSNNKSQQDFVIENSTAGGTSVNDTLVHIANPELPFGGVNNSGIGKTHGHYGFLAFSNERAVLKQRVGWTIFKTLYPPYTDKKKKTINQFSKFV